MITKIVLGLLLISSATFAKEKCIDTRVTLFAPCSEGQERQFIQGRCAESYEAENTFCANPRKISLANIRADQLPGQYVGVQITVVNPTDEVPCYVTVTKNTGAFHFSTKSVNSCGGQPTVGDWCTPPYNYEVFEFRRDVMPDELVNTSSNTTDVDYNVDPPNYFQIPSKGQNQFLRLIWSQDDSTVLESVDLEYNGEFCSGLRKM